MAENSRARRGFRPSNWLWLLVLSAIAAGLYVTAFLKFGHIG